MDSDGKVGAEVVRVVISVCNVTYRRPIPRQSGEYLYPVKRLREIRGYYGKFDRKPGLIKRLWKWWRTPSRRRWGRCC